MDNLGFIAALVAALAWGSYMTPFKKSKATDFILFQFLMSVGILISGLILSVISGYSLSINIFGLMSGTLWAIGNIISLTVFANLGLSKGGPLLSSIVILVSFLWGALFFAELPSGMLMGFLGIALIILGVVTVSSTGGATTTLNVKKGLIAGLFAGAIFGSQLVPVKWAQLDAGDYYFSMSVGIFLTASVIAVVKGMKLRTVALKESLISGVVWNVGNLAALISVSLIGLSKGFPISQSAVLISVLWGVYYFKEITQKKARLQVLIGALVLLSGVIMLGFA